MDSGIGGLQRCVKNYSKLFGLEMLNYIEIWVLSGFLQFNTKCHNWSYYDLGSCQFFAGRECWLLTNSLLEGSKLFVKFLSFLFYIYFPCKSFVKMEPQVKSSSHWGNEGILWKVTGHSPQGECFVYQCLLLYPPFFKSGFSSKEFCSKELRYFLGLGEEERNILWSANTQVTMSGLFGLSEVKMGYRRGARIRRCIESMRRTWYKINKWLFPLNVII